jgi:hypothetical protein
MEYKLIEINNTTPFPTDPQPGPGRPRKYPFDALSVGGSFFVPDKKAKDIAPSMTLARLRTGFTFVTRNEPHGVRIWRKG